MQVNIFQYWQAEEEASVVGTGETDEAVGLVSPPHAILGEEEEASVIGTADTDEAVGLVTHPSAILGSMWIRHPNHGLVRRSARIAARNAENSG
jgi:hypothetical protein